MHFGRQQHNKVLIVRRNGQPIRVLTGSTNFSLRGLYIQANNALVFDDDSVAAKFGELFDAYWTSPKKFRQNALSQAVVDRARRSRFAGRALLLAALGQRRCRSIPSRGRSRTPRARCSTRSCSSTSSPARCATRSTS